MALRAYAALLFVAGVAMAGWGPLWFGSHLHEIPWGKAALIRMVGAVLLAAGVLAVGLSAEDSLGRKRMLPWFIAAHAVVWTMLVIQSAGPLGDVAMARHVAWTMLAVILGLLYVRFPSEWPAPRPASLALSASRQRSDSTSLGLQEQQIREAAAQEERNRLARDLHDAIKQQIFAIQTSAATAEARLGADVAGARDALAQVRQSAREAMTEMEAMLEQLRVAPLGSTGVVEAIRKHCEALAFRTGAVVDVQVGQLPSENALGPGAYQAIFRIVQEALANVGRHSRARHVAVSLGTTPACVEVRVRDDGRGFDENAASGGMGMHNMRTRAREIGGSVEIGKADGVGTLVTLSIPFETADARRHLRRRALGLAALLGVAIVLLLVNLVEKGPGLGNVSLVVFGLLFAGHLRTWLRLRRAGDSLGPTHESPTS